jgi:hypothetical protein
MLVRAARAWRVRATGEIVRSAVPRVTSQTIVGRDEPLRLLDGVLGAAVDGRPQVVLLAGEAGVGKTRLAVELERRAGERGFLVLHGECIEFGGDAFAYAPLVAALRDLPAEWAAAALEDLDDESRGDLAGLLPRASIPHAASSSGRYGKARLCELVLHLLGRLGDEQAPVLLVLEDLHWADRSTRDLLAFVARGVRAERLTVAATYRTGELHRGHPLRRLVTEMARRPPVTRVDLAPLARAEVAVQLEAIAGEPVPARLADELHARSGGNPFFVEELFAAGGDAATLTDAVFARVHRLSPAAQRLLAALAAAGGRAEPEVLEPVVRELGPALREALDAGLVVESVALRHGLIGEVVYGSLVAGERTALHRALGRAMVGAPAARLADQCTGPASTTPRSPRRSRPAWTPSGCTRSRRRAGTSRERSSCGRRPRRGPRSTASSCSPAPPRRRVSPATASGRWRSDARRSRSST